MYSIHFRTKVTLHFTHIYSIDILHTYKPHMYKPHMYSSLLTFVLYAHCFIHIHNICSLVFAHSYYMYSSFHTFVLYVHYSSHIHSICTLHTSIIYVLYFTHIHIPNILLYTHSHEPHHSILTCHNLNPLCQSNFSSTTSFNIFQGQGPSRRKPFST